MAKLREGKNLLCPKQYDNSLTLVAPANSISIFPARSGLGSRAESCLQRAPVKLKTGLLNHPGKVLGRSVNKKGKDCHELLLVQRLKDRKKSKICQLMMLAVV